MSDLKSAIDQRGNPRFACSNALLGKFTTKKPRAVEYLRVHRVRQVQVHPTAGLNRRFDLSPIDALIYLVVRSRLRCQIPVRLDLHPVTGLRITVIPQRWPACGGYARGLGVDTDVVQNLSDLRALSNEGDQAHLPTPHRTQQRELSISWGQSWFAARNCGLSRKVSGVWQSTLPTGSAPVSAWAARTQAVAVAAATGHQRRPHCPLAPPQAQHRLRRFALAEQASPAQVWQKPPQQPSVASSVPEHQSSGAGECAAVAPRQRYALSAPVA